MKYTKPLNETNEDAGYVNADVSIGRRGSTVPAEAIEAPQREIVAAHVGGQETVGVDAQVFYCQYDLFTVDFAHDALTLLSVFRR